MTPTTDPAATLEPPAKASPLRRFGPLALLVLALVLFFALGGQRYVTLDELTRRRQALTMLADNHPVLAPLGLIVVYAALVAACFPGASLLTIFAGFMFGTLLGGLCVLIGATAGATLLFLAARTALGDILARRAGPLLDRFRQGFSEDAAGYLLTLRLIPVLPFWLVNIAPALLGVRLRTFVITTFVGIIPATFVYAAIGAGAGTTLDAGGTLDLKGILLQPAFLLPLAGLALLSLIPIIVKKVRRQRG